LTVAKGIQIAAFFGGGYRQAASDAEGPPKNAFLRFSKKHPKKERWTPHSNFHGEHRTDLLSRWNSSSRFLETIEGAIDEAPGPRRGRGEHFHRSDLRRSDQGDGTRPSHRRDG
jgi:hypothetical protein